MIQKSLERNNARRDEPTLIALESVLSLAVVTTVASVVVLPLEPSPPVSAEPPQQASEIHFSINFQIFKKLTSASSASIVKVRKVSTCERSINQVTSFSLCTTCKICPIAGTTLTCKECIRALKTCDKNHRGQIIGKTHLIIASGSICTGIVLGQGTI